MNQSIQFPAIKDLNLKRQARIISTGVGLPEHIVTNQDIIDKYDIIATDRAVKFSLGIQERRWAELHENLDDLLAEAAAKCLERAGIDINQVSRIIYTKLLGDCQVPASSVGMLKKLGSNVGIPAFDISSACSGFMHVMDLALRFIASGDEYVLIIGGGITSRAVQRFEKPNPKTVFLYGDAIVAMLIGYSEVKHFLASYIFTNHLLYDNAYVPCGTSLLKQGLKNVNTDMFNMQVKDGNVILESSVQYSKEIADKLLSSTGLSLDDIDYFITSDQSTKIWEAQLKALGIPPHKSLSLFYKYGNTVAAMSPLILHELIISGKLKRGNLVMMMAHGAGASSGGMIFKY